MEIQNVVYDYFYVDLFDYFEFFGQFFFVFFEDFDIIVYEVDSVQLNCGKQYGDDIYVVQFGKQ